MMKQQILWASLIFLGACSVDPGGASKSQGPGDAIELEVEEVSAPSGISQDANPDGTVSQDKGGDAESGSQKPPVAPAPGNKPDRVVEDDDAISPPHPVTGTYLTASVLAETGDGVIRVGLKANRGEERLGKDPAYALKWHLGDSSDLPVKLNLIASEEDEYDQVLEFYGTEDDLAAYQDEIQIQLSVTEEGTGLNEITLSRLGELFGE